ncbi:MAG: dUTP diphosphatase [bacterium]
MKIKIKRIDKTLPLPKYHTAGAVAFDLYSRVDDNIKAGEIKLLPANFIIKTPNGYMLLVASRSSLAKKKSLKLANGVGIIDQDYCGEDDEIHLLLHNYSSQDVEIEKGERLAQAMFVRIDKAELEEVEEMDSKSRGGFGSTG